MNKLKLEVVDRYALTPDQIGEFLGGEGWTRASARWSFVMPDGRFASILRGQLLPGEPDPYALALFDAGAAKVLPIEPPAMPKELWDFSAFAISDQVMMLRGTRNLTSVSTIEPYSSAEWTVINDIADGDSDSPNLAVRPYETSQIIAPAGMAAIPLRGLSEGRRLGFLKLDKGARRARWAQWPARGPRALPARSHQYSKLDRPGTCPTDSYLAYGQASIGMT